MPKIPEPSFASLVTLSLVFAYGVPGTPSRTSAFSR